MKFLKYWLGDFSEDKETTHDEIGKIFGNLDYLMHQFFEEMDRIEDGSDKNFAKSHMEQSLNYFLEKLKKT